MDNQTLSDLSELLAICAKSPQLLHDRGRIAEIEARYQEEINAMHERRMIAAGCKREGKWWVLPATH